LKVSFCLLANIFLFLSVSICTAHRPPHHLPGTLRELRLACESCVSAQVPVPGTLGVSQQAPFSKLKNGSKNQNKFRNQCLRGFLSLFQFGGPALQVRSNFFVACGQTWPRCERPPRSQEAEGGGSSMALRIPSVFRTVVSFLRTWSALRTKGGTSRWPTTCRRRCRPHPLPPARSSCSQPPPECRTSRAS
jgi:hypothetical protein